MWNWITVRQDGFFLLWYQPPFSETVRTYWACYRGNPQNTGSVDKEVELKGQKKWEVSLDCEINFNSSPVFMDSKLYIGGKNRQLYCIEADSGKIDNFWQVKGPITSTPVIEDGYLYLEAGDGRVYSLNLASSDIDWEFLRKSNSSGHSPVIGDGKFVYVIGDENKTIYALNINTGELMWSFSGEKSVTFSSPSLSEDMIYMGASNGFIYCLDCNTGILLGQFDCQACVGLIVIGEKYLYTVVTETALSKETDFYTALYALDLVTGEKIWEFKFDDQIFIPALIANTIYIGCQNKSLYALNAITGEQSWIIKEQSYPVSVTGCDGFLYVGLYDGTVFALDTEAKHKIWTLKVEGIPGLPAIMEEVLYIPTDNGRIYAIE